MPVFHGTLFQIDRSEMMRYAGLPPKGSDFPEALIRESIEEASALASPRGIWQLLPYDAQTGTLFGAPPLCLEGGRAGCNSRSGYRAGQHRLFPQRPVCQRAAS